MAEATGGTLLVEALLRQGVSHLFTVSGGQILPAYDAAVGRPLRLIHTRHEAAAVLMADGWARVTGDPAACLFTLGPGVTNAVTGAFVASLAGTPVVVMAAGVPSDRYDMGAIQDLDQVALMRPVTKWAVRVLDVRRVPEYVAAAFRQARSGRPGPVFLEFPSNILAAKLPAADKPVPVMPRPAGPPEPDPAAIQEAAALLRRAARPLIVGGSGIFWARAGDSLRAVVEAAGAPLFLDRLGRGAVPAEHALHFGLAALPLNPVAVAAFKDADCVLLAGARLDYNLEFGRAPFWQQAARLIQIDILPEEIGRNRAVDVPIVADARRGLTALAACLRAAGPAPDRAGWLGALREGRRRAWEELTPHLHSDGEPIHPLRLVREIRDFLPRDAIVAAGSGDIDFWASALLDQQAPGTFLRVGQAGSLGCEIPYGIAAKLARPGAPVLVTVGDGGFGFSGMEFDTAARYGVPIVCVVGNDAGWGMIRQRQLARYGADRAVGTDLAPRPYERIAEALGGHGEAVTRPEEIKGALARAFESGRPACVNVRIRSVASPMTTWGLSGPGGPSAWRLPEAREGDHA
ncbi:MAG TPA: thiamine pyrophosphate-binding protein [Candidatus Methylomirabilis sp.]|jgi:acetolactate synthase-1/2/3 large subunit